MLVNLTEVASVCPNSAHPDGRVKGASTGEGLPPGASARARRVSYPTFSSVRPPVRHLWRFHLSEKGVPRLVVARVLASAHSVWCLGTCLEISEA